VSIYVCVGLRECRVVWARPGESEPFRPAVIITDHHKDDFKKRVEHAMRVEGEENVPCLCVLEINFDVGYRNVLWSSVDFAAISLELIIFINVHNMKCRYAVPVFHM